MPRFIAFLRAINVGGHNVKMHELRAHFEALGFTDVETVIASGNVVFTSKKKESQLQPLIEAKLAKTLGYEVKTFLRSDVEVAALAASKVFSAAARAKAPTFNIGFLHEPLSAAAKKRWTSLSTAMDDCRTNGRELYWLCQTRQSESALFSVSFERVLGVPMTFRGMKTIERIAAKYPPI